MTELEPDDLRWAESFGARWGVEYPDPMASTAEISHAAAEAANTPLNQAAVAHQKRVLGVDENAQLTSEQAAAGAPYLMALAEVVLREVQWAIWWRRDQIKRDGNDPGPKYLTYRPKPGFREFLEAVGPTTGGRINLTPEGGQPRNAHLPTETEIETAEPENAQVTTPAASDDIETTRTPFWRRWKRRDD
ncbi:hypothetical protein WDU99_13815 [Microbacterium sp. Mu-80]|uniref:Uncharacterized protein n=1 Tax=Microbacterium bandirmense TaxID=3122050 RepID=A0ABU8LDH9_9MICO